MIIPESAIVPNMATNPNGWLKRSMNAVTPISPSGAVSTTIATREKLCSWIISTVRTTRMKSGNPAATDFWPRALSSTAPPVSMR